VTRGTGRSDSQRNHLRATRPVGINHPRVASLRRVAVLPWTTRPICRGLAGRIRMERVAEFSGIPRGAELRTNIDPASRDFEEREWASSQGNTLPGCVSKRTPTRSQPHVDSRSPSAIRARPLWLELDVGLTHSPPILTHS
jgi:hypothetical protein